MSKLYKHLKSGNVYRIISENGKLESNWEDAILYQDASNRGGPIITRSAKEFYDGRFEYIGNEPESLKFDPFKDIAAFHEKFGLAYDGHPRALDGELREFRVKFIQEEFDEYRSANAKALQEVHATHGSFDQGEYTIQLEHALDGLVDLVYVTLGTAYLHGFNFEEAWKRVHFANMAKVRATEKTQSLRGSTLDVVKPAGWMPPVLTDLVEVNQKP